MVSSTSRPNFTPGKDPVPIVQEARWAPGLVWTGRKYLPHWDSIPDRPVCSQSLYRLSYLAHTYIKEYLHTIIVIWKRWYRPKSWPCAFALPMKCSSEKPSHSRTVPLGQAGVCTVCECLVKKKPRLFGGGPGGAGSPLEPGKPANKKLPSGCCTAWLKQLSCKWFINIITLTCSLSDLRFSQQYVREFRSSWDVTHCINGFVVNYWHSSLINTVFSSCAVCLRLAWWKLSRKNQKWNGSAEAHKVEWIKTQIKVENIMEIWWENMKQKEPLGRYTQMEW